MMQKDLVRAAYLQNRGIGRGMKVGKESIAGVMVALEAWEKRDHAGIRSSERQALDLWLTTLQAIPGVAAEIVPDPTNNPLDRLKVMVLPDSGFSAASLAAALAAGFRTHCARRMPLASLKRAKGTASNRCSAGRIDA
jgi:D-glucosaminate-6-phosphate ammonia-lyase